MVSMHGKKLAYDIQMKKTKLIRLSIIVLAIPVLLLSGCSSSSSEDISSSNNLPASEDTFDPIALIEYKACLNTPPNRFETAGDWSVYMYEACASRLPELDRGLTYDPIETIEYQACLSSPPNRFNSFGEWASAMFYECMSKRPKPF